jgi:glycosyltransferase involved in cell wall biosynthesis
MLLERTINRIKATCAELPELVIVFDGDSESNYAIDYPEELLITTERIESRGTSVSRHDGILLATNDTIFTTDAHINPITDGWLEVIERECIANPLDILCCKMIGFKPGSMGKPDSDVYTGADLSLLSRDSRGRDILAAKWSDNDVGVIQIVMGAGYVMSRKRYIDIKTPWMVNTGWGSDEETISIVNWICGGNSRLIDVTIAHPFGLGYNRKPDPSYKIKTMSNRIAMSHYLPMSYSRRKEMKSWISSELAKLSNPDADSFLKHDKIEVLRKHLKTMTRTFEDFVDEFGCKDCFVDCQPPNKTPKARKWATTDFFGSRDVSVDRHISIMGLSRSGTHALSDWIGSQITGKLRFVSGINIGELRSNNHKIFERGSKLPTADTSRTDGESVFLTTMECADPCYSGSIPWLDEKEFTRILLLRDPYNWMASYIKSGFRVVRRNAIDTLWLEYFEEFRNPPEGTICVNYNHFVSSESYRDSLAEKIGIDIRSDESLRSVSKAGGGSSFDGRLVRGDEMDVLTRYKEMGGNDLYERMISNRDLIEPAFDLFGISL